MAKNVNNIKHKETAPINVSKAALETQLKLKKMKVIKK